MALNTALLDINRLFNGINTSNAKLIVERDSLIIERNTLNNQKTALSNQLKLQKIILKHETDTASLSEMILNKLDMHCKSGNMKPSSDEGNFSIIQQYDKDLKKVQNELGLKNKKILNLQSELKDVKSKCKKLLANSIMSDEKTDNKPAVTDKTIVSNAENNTDKKFNLGEYCDQIVEPVVEVIVFTDGSCKNNGKTTATAGVGIHFPSNLFGFKDSSTPCVVQKGTVTNNIAELTAIKEALYMINDKIKDGNPQKITNIKLYSDSEYSIKILTRTNKYQSHRVLIESIFHIQSILKDNNVNIEYIHVKAHTGANDFASLGNKQADLLAVNGNTLLSTVEEPVSVHIQPEEVVDTPNEVVEEQVVEQVVEVVVDEVVVMNTCKKDMNTSKKDNKYMNTGKKDKKDKKVKKNKKDKKAKKVKKVDKAVKPCEPEPV